MENEPEVVVEETAEETTLDLATDEPETVTIPKDKFTKMQRKAIAYDANKSKTINSIEERPQVKAQDILKSPEFRLHREGYTEPEIEVIMQNGGPSILERQDNIITMGIKAAREQRRAVDAADAVRESSGLSDIERKFTEQDMRNMSKEELAKLLPHTNN